MSLILSIVGAECTGKSTLALALAPALTQQTGQAWVVVHEHLRQWCDARGRTPRAHEQQCIAREQGRQIALAARHAHVIADTSALMVAVYSQVIFDDDSLLPDAIAQERLYAHTFVMQADFAWQPDGFQRDGPQQQSVVGQCLERALRNGSCRFDTLSGPLETRMAQVTDRVRRTTGRFS